MYKSLGDPFNLSGMKKNALLVPSKDASEFFASNCTKNVLFFAKDFYVYLFRHWLYLDCLVIIKNKLVIKVWIF